MGISSSKIQHIEKDFPLNETITNDTIASIDSALSSGTMSTLSPFQRIRNLSFANRYEKFPVADKNHSLSMNNLEGELTPKRSPTGLKQRLIKALGGYNLLDPRSPSQFIARTPIIFSKKQPQTTKVQSNSIANIKEKILETSMNEEKKTVVENRYSIFEEQLDEESDGLEVEDKHSTPNKSTSDPGFTDKDMTSHPLDEFNELFSTSKDPRSISDGIQRTPFTFAIGVLETPVLEIHQVQEVENLEEKSTLKTLTTQSLIKTIYKEYNKRDNIYNNLLNGEDADDGKTTPIKKSFNEMPKERTPLSCIVNQHYPLSSSKRNLNPKKKLLDDLNEDLYSPKAFEILHDGEENTPNNPKNISQLNTFSSITKSQSKIPVSRTRRLH